MKIKHGAECRLIERITPYYVKLYENKFRNLCTLIFIGTQQALSGLKEYFLKVEKYFLLTHGHTIQTKSYYL